MNTIRKMFFLILIAIFGVSCSPVANQIVFDIPTPQPTPISFVAPGPNYLYTFNASQDGYDERVGNGYLFLKTGYSYTFDYYGILEQVEVRQILDERLIGYALLIDTYDSNGAFRGLEQPIALIDNNGDGLVSIQELDNAIAKQREEVKGLIKSQPTLAIKFDKEITSAYDAIQSGAIADAYRKIKQLQTELNYVSKTLKDALVAKEQAIKNQKRGVFVIGVNAIVLLSLIVFLVLRRRKSEGISSKGKSSKKVFLSFAKSDLFRAKVVRKSFEMEGTIIVGFFNAVDFEELESRGDDAIMNWIDEQMEDVSVTAVLVGSETCSDKWIKYTIEKSIEKRTGLLGIDISKIKDAEGNKTSRCGKIPEGYPFYLWNKDNGKENIRKWINVAASTACE